MERLYRHGDEILQVSARRDGAKVRLLTPQGERAFEWEELGPGDYLLRADGVQRRCVVARDGEDRWIWIEGHTHHLKVTSTARKRGGPSAGTLLAPMPGQVLQVHVKPGETVRKDQVLLVLEAMKMQYEIVAPRDGVVESVQASPGAQVAGGIALVTLAEEGAA